MIRRIFVLVAAAAMLASPQIARGYSLTCFEAAQAVTSNDDLLIGSAVGYALGSTDLLAGLQCYVGRSSCNCLANLPRNRPEDFGGAVGQELAACINRGDGNSPAFGPVLAAAKRFCSF